MRRVRTNAELVLFPPGYHAFHVLIYFAPWKFWTGPSSELFGPGIRIETFALASTHTMYGPLQSLVRCAVTPAFRCDATYRNHRVTNGKLSLKNHQIVTASPPRRMADDT